MKIICNKQLQKQFLKQSSWHKQNKHRFYSMSTQVVKGSVSLKYIQGTLVIIFIQALKARLCNLWVSLVGDGEFQGGNSFQNQSWWFQNRSCFQSKKSNFYIEECFLKEEATGTKFSWESHLTIHHLTVANGCFPNSETAGQEAAQSMTSDPGAC